MRRDRWRWIARFVGHSDETAPSRLGAEDRRLTPVELEQALIAGKAPVLIDIRSPEAFAAGHLPGAVLVPLGELARAAEHLDRCAPTVVY